jgi:hypothetical protein
LALRTARGLIVATQGETGGESTWSGRQPIRRRNGDKARAGHSNVQPGEEWRAMRAPEVPDPVVLREVVLARIAGDEDSALSLLEIIGCRLSTPKSHESVSVGNVSF